jgi:hypothetical protein
MSSSLAYLTSRADFVQVSPAVPVTKARKPDKVDAPDVLAGALAHDDERGMVAEAAHQQTRASSCTMSSRRRSRLSTLSRPCPRRRLLKHRCAAFLCVSSLTHSFGDTGGAPCGARGGDDRRERGVRARARARKYVPLSVCPFYSTDVCPSPTENLLAQIEGALGVMLSDPDTLAAAPAPASPAAASSSTPSSASTPPVVPAQRPPGTSALVAYA